jgi:hypothetical protein
VRQQPSEQANSPCVELQELVNMPKVAKKTRQDASKSSKDDRRKRLCGKADAPDLPVVKFKAEELGNRACCCRIGR